MKKVLAMLILLFPALFLTACGSVNTAGNAAIYADSPLAGYEITAGERYTAIESPWLAVRTDQQADGTETIQILGVSEELAKTPFSAELLAQVRTLILCSITEGSAKYKSQTTGVVSTGTTEIANLYYYAVDHAAGTLTRYAGSDSVSNELPEKKTGSAPHLVVSDRQILKAAAERAASGVAPLHETGYFGVDKNGVLWHTAPTKKHLSRIVIPESVTRIMKITFMGINKQQTTTVWIPPTVEEIENGMFCQKRDRYLLVVAPGSYAERYAIEHEIDYRNGTGVEDVQP